MTITKQKLEVILRRRYPHAAIYVLDAEYDMPTRAEADKLYKGFIRRMATSRLTAWIKNVGDCDKWAWLLKASAILKAWLSGGKNSHPYGLLCYCVGGDLSRGHAINNIVWTDGEYEDVEEIESQPNGGFVKLTQEELKSAWLVIV